MKMIRLQDYISGKYNFPSDEAQTFDSFLANNNIQNPTKEQCLWFSENVCSNDSSYYNSYDGSASVSQYITEMLNTTSPEILKKELNKQLPGDTPISFYGEDTTEKPHRFFVPEDRYLPDKIADICDKYMWAFTSVEGENHKQLNPVFSIKPKYFLNTKKGFKYVVITVEPVKAKQVTEYVYNDCNGKLYHITSESNAKLILKTGLRVKGTKNSYRFINNRVFFVCSPDEKQLQQSIITTARSKGLKEFRVLLVDVSNYNIDFFKDPFYIKDCVYAYTYFPPQIISDVTNKFT